MPLDWVSLTWADNVEGDFAVELRIQGENRRGMLARVATEIAAEDSSIESVNMNDRTGDVADMRIVITVQDRAHLARVLRRIRRIGLVERVQRI